MVASIGVGMNRETGERLDGWPHVAQSLGDIFSTRFGERVMRRYYGSLVPRLLGENMVPETYIRFFAAVGVALEQEPRVRLLQVTPLSVNRNGRSGIEIDLEYRPRGHLGDFTPAGRKRVALNGSGPTFDVTDTTNG
jgi:phage baseplate assembly protein W